MASTPPPRPVDLQWEQLVLDTPDPEALGRWWAGALGWMVVNPDPEEFEIRPAPDHLPGILFARVPDRKRTKNRLHLDLRPSDQVAAVEHFVSLGARHVDVGQGDVSWVVLADPEGNEFCVLRERAG